MFSTLVLTLLLASDASPPDAPDPGEIRALATALQVAMAGDELLSRPGEIQVILSAQRCEALDRQAATEERLQRAPVDRATFRQLTRAAVRASADVEAARERLTVLEIEPVLCKLDPATMYDLRTVVLVGQVNHLALCLGAVVDLDYCQRGHVAAQVAAAERLQEVR